MHDPAPPPVTGTVSDATGTFGLQSGFSIQEDRGLTFFFQSRGRSGYEIEILDWTIDLTPERARSLIAGALITIPASETVSRAVYPVGRGGVVRPVLSVQFTIANDLHRADLVVELGPVASTEGEVPATFSPSATIRLRGVFRVGCAVRGRVVGQGAGTPVYEYVQDTTFSTAFCRNAVTEFGLLPLLRLNNIPFGA